MTGIEKTLREKGSNIRSMYVGAGVAFALAAALLTGLAIYLSPSALSAFLPKKVISTGKHGNSPLSTSSTEMTLDPNETMQSETTTMASTNLSALGNTTTTATIPTTVQQWNATTGCRACTMNKRGQLLASANLKSGEIQLTDLGRTLVIMKQKSDPTPDDTNNCDVRALLNITVPEGSVIRFDFAYGSDLDGYATIDIGDSQYSKGYGASCEFHPSASQLVPVNTYSDDCAEMRLWNSYDGTNTMLFYGAFLPDYWTYRGVPAGSDASPNLELKRFKNVIRPSMTFWAGHRYMAATNYDTMNFCMDSDIVFLPEQPSKSPNNNIYFGMNRNVLEDSFFPGSGLCEANVYLLESCMT